MAAVKLKPNTRLKFLDRYLSVWIILAMVLGVAIGVLFPDIQQIINHPSINKGSTNFLLAVGLILMMYPPFVKVNYIEFLAAFKDVKLLATGLFFNWILAPLFMFMLAYLFVPNDPSYFTGLVLIGIAPCIAMVMVWNELAGGNRAYATALVALNSILQILFYGLYAWFLLHVLPTWLDLKAVEINITMAEIATTVWVYLGIPFLLGFLSRVLIIKIKGLTWLQTKFIPIISPITLWSLLFTIILMFSMKGEMMFELPFEVLWIALPLCIFFIVMFLLVWFTSKKIGFEEDKIVTLAFTGASNNFELAIAIAVGLFGMHSKEAFAGVIGPLVEVPVMLLLVKIAYRFKSK